MKSVCVKNGQNWVRLDGFGGPYQQLQAIFHSFTMLWTSVSTFRGVLEGFATKKCICSNHKINQPVLFYIGYFFAFAYTSL